MLHLLTLLNFLIYIQVRISLLKITIERLSWYYSELEVLYNNVSIRNDWQRGYTT